MTKEQAEDIVFDLNRECILLNMEATVDLITKEGYPGLSKIYLEHINGSSSVREYFNRATQHLQVSDTKLYKAMK